MEEKIVINLEDLRLSQPVEHDINRPKPFWDVLDEIHAVLDDNKITFVQDDIHIDKTTAYNTKNKAYTGKLTKASLNQWVFDDLLTRIVIADDLLEMEGTVLLAYNKYGIQVAFGLAYHDRSTIALLGEEDTFMSTSACGDIKIMPYFVMVHKVSQWFPINKRNVLDQLERSKSVMNRSVSRNDMKQFVEKFYQYSVH